jgi:hypothetical protein
MTDVTADEEPDVRSVFDAFAADLAPQEDDNRLIPLLESGQAPVSVVGALAAEQTRIIPSDKRSFLLLAARASATSPSGEFFAGLAAGENTALALLPALAAAGGFDTAGVVTYRPEPHCQAYPAYVAWLSLNAAPVEAALALLANFAAWGAYCGRAAAALRANYGFDDDACAFFDLFAAPVPGAEEQALAVAREALGGAGSLDAALAYGRLVQSYELMFWNRLADLAGVT